MGGRESKEKEDAKAGCNSKKNSTGLQSSVHAAYSKTEASRECHCPKPLSEPWSPLEHKPFGFQEPWPSGEGATGAWQVAQKVGIWEEHQGVLYRRRDKKAKKLQESSPCFYPYFRLHV